VAGAERARGAGTEGALAALAEALGEQPPASFIDADPEAVLALAEAVRRAEADQAAQLRDAVDRSFEHVPRLLRGPVRKLLGGRR
jgi:hypothetical protein